MPRTVTKKRTVEVVDELDVTSRDYVMARLLAARASFQASIDAIDECAALFVNPDDDKKGDERKELIDSALEAAGAGSRALESAEETFDQIDPTEGEPWDEDDDDDEEDEDGDANE